MFTIKTITEMKTPESPLTEKTVETTCGHDGGCVVSGSSLLMTQPDGDGWQLHSHYHNDIGGTATFVAWQRDV